MDEEKFDRLLMDELYGELDPETSAAMKRWAAAHPRAGEKLAALGAARRAAGEALAPVAPPEDLEDKILAAARQAQTVLPFRRRAAVAMSRAGAWAMRPQTAMAAVFLLMVGSSALLLRGKYTPARSAASYEVSEHGAPEAVAAPSPEEAKALDPATADLAHGTGAKDEMKASAPAAQAAAAPSALEKVDEDRKTAPTKGVARRSEPARDDYAPSMDQAASAPYAANQATGSLGEGSGRGWAAPPPPAAPAPAQAARPRVATKGDSIENAGSVAGAPTATAAPAGGGALAGLAPAAGPAPGGGAKAEDKQGGGDAFARAMAAYRARSYTDATSTWDALAASGDLDAELWAARSTREGRGCAAALPRFDGLASRAFATVAGQEATMDAGRCYKALGDAGAARQRFTRLLTVPGLMASAQRELDALGPPQARAAPAKPATKQKAAEAN